jgi:hypothetical protein
MYPGDFHISSYEKMPLKQDVIRDKNYTKIAKLKNAPN